MSNPLAVQLDHLKKYYEFIENHGLSGGFSPLHEDTLWEMCVCISGLCRPVALAKPTAFVDGVYPVMHTDVEGWKGEWLAFLVQPMKDIINGDDKSESLMALTIAELMLYRMERYRLHTVENLVEIGVGQTYHGWEKITEVIVGMKQIAEIVKDLQPIVKAVYPDYYVDAVQVELSLYEPD